MKRKFINLLCCTLACTTFLSNANVYAANENYVSRYDFVTRLCDPNVCNVEFICVEYIFHLSKLKSFFINPTDKLRLRKIDEYHAEDNAAYINPDSDELKKFIRNETPEAIYIKAEECTANAVKQLTEEGYYELPENSEWKPPAWHSKIKDADWKVYCGLNLPRSKFNDINLSEYPWVVDCDGIETETSYYAIHSSLNQSAARFAGAEMAGLLHGRGDNTFNPKDFITKEDMAVIVYRMLNSQNFMAIQGTPVDLPLPAPDTGKLAKYSDAEMISPYATEALSVLIQTGLFEVGANNTINPKGYMTDQEVQVLCNRLSALLDSYGIKSRVYIDDYGVLAHRNSLD